MTNICNTSSSSSSSAFMVLLLAALLVSLTTTDALKSKVARFEFYMHDVLTGPNPTAIQVIQSQSTNSTPASPFGNMAVIDNPLTTTPNRDSTLIGRSQGIYVVASSAQSEISFFMSLTYLIVSGPYNGSTFSVVGRNPFLRDVREMPVVGGTGIFRLARGYCFAHTYSMDGLNAVIRYNVTLLHY